MRVGEPPILVAAGRRIDADPSETSRFPLQNVDIVRQRLRQIMLEHQPAGLVSSAACGADLLAQEVAADLGIRRWIVLPFAAACFRRTSVIDRPGNWGPIFDRLVGVLTAPGQVSDLRLDPAASDVYAATNLAILERALALTGGVISRVLAIVIWDGHARASSDYSAAFAEAARERGMRVLSVPTL
jgi:hypothetical protein